MLFLLFLVHKHHHIAYRKIARKDDKEESGYLRRVDLSIIV